MDDFFNTTFTKKLSPNLAKPSYGQSHFSYTTKLKKEKKKKKKEIDSNFQPSEFDCEAALSPSGD
jgi:hypothetical protein